jgi:hypothetical protein
MFTPAHDGKNEVLVLDHLPVVLPAHLPDGGERGESFLCHGKEGLSPRLCCCTLYELFFFELFEQGVNGALTPPVVSAISFKRS